MAELVDATDLKFVDFLNHEGSSPSFPKNFLYYFINLIYIIGIIFLILYWVDARVVKGDGL